MLEFPLTTLFEHPEFIEGVQWVKQKFNAGEHIFCQGDVGGSLYVVFSGKVRITTAVTLENKRRIEPSICDVEKDGIFGEIAVFYKSPRTASAVAIEDTVLAIIDGKKLLFFMDKHKEIGYDLMKKFYENIVQRLVVSTVRFGNVFAWGLKAHNIDKHII